MVKKIISGVLFLLLHPAVTQSATPTMLLYGPTSGCYENTTPGYNITIWNAAQWASATTAQFAAFNVIVIADCPYCITAPSTIYDAAIANAPVWSAAVTGNQLIVGTDPDDHVAAGNAPVSLIYNFINFAASGTGTGLYVSLSCFFQTDPPGTSVPLLSALGSFTVEGAGGCSNAVHKIANNPALNGVTDALLSNWTCSVHEGFDTWPAGYLPLAIATDAANPNYTAPDLTTGLVFMLAKGNSVVPVPTPCVAGGNTCTPTFTPTFTYTPTMTNTPTLTPTNTPCGFPGNTCTPTFTPTPTPTPYTVDIFTADKNIFVPSQDKFVTLNVQYSQVPGPYSLRIYNTAGEHIKDLDSMYSTVLINKTYQWDGTNKFGEPCASGLYIIYLLEPFNRKVKKLILIR